MRNTGSMAAALAVSLSLVLAVPAFGQDVSVELVASGLDSPRGLTIGPDGAVYVAEAGEGGDTCLTGVPGRGRFCVGSSGAVTRISDGHAERIIVDLPSISSTGEIHGPSDVSFFDEGRLYVVTNLAGHPADREAMPPEIGRLAGHLLVASLDGALEPLADVAAFEASSNPDAEFSSGEVFSNPHSVASADGAVVVVDAGGNSLLQVDDDGTVSSLAVFPPLTLGYAQETEPAQGEPGEGEVPESIEPAQPVMVPVQAVPTSVAVGPDGAWYVGELTGGPYEVGAASVWRIRPGEAPDRYATGFSNIIDLSFGPDGTLYVAEISASSLMDVFEGENAPVGAVLAIPPEGGEPELIISDDRVVAPGGIAVDSDGTIYLSTGTLTPGGGSVVRIRR